MREFAVLAVLTETFRDLRIIARTGKIKSDEMMRISPRNVVSDERLEFSSILFGGAHKHKII